ncbi:MAG: hypothetical protein HOL51_21710 [Gemmatimonadetes bacterium]|nr:hypothetical protein [Gemmatimonadota bacterium]MBT5328735.1 hypothetical protein [Gemmatimonadota bacterium]MBT5452109.1 hypothetical protein [Gemmatimonadota bacterium]MBT5801708.1 hypothetical protein [Gemmatimonadota bacterium]MBT6623290.1 hypothetical protein [Gemmatimonadota bacterium]
MPAILFYPIGSNPGQGALFLAQGRVEKAATAYAVPLPLGAVEELRREAERGQGLGLGILQRHWRDEE